MYVYFIYTGLPTSRVRDLTVCYAVNDSTINLNVTWQQPQWLEGKLRFYEIVVMINGEEFTNGTAMVSVYA